MAEYIQKFSWHLSLPIRGQRNSLASIQLYVCLFQKTIYFKDSSLWKALFILPKFPVTCLSLFHLCHNTSTLELPISFGKSSSLNLKMKYFSWLLLVTLLSRTVDKRIFFTVSRGMLRSLIASSLKYTDLHKHGFLASFL